MRLLIPPSVPIKKDELVNLRRRLAATSLALTIGASGAALATPAQATTWGSIKICVTDGSFTGMGVYDTDSSYADSLVNNNDCTVWLYPVGIRVDTDLFGPSHSYRIKPTGTGASNVWGPCHENSDNHASDPPQSNDGDSWTIWYKNYDDGNCSGNG